ncbi:MAG: RNA-binding domain-containing protein [Candidatus Nezhaarchaeota archaeon]|nr:RNA-binding domain-containing protein [Candidatus Nezhaarchaeota archaeon]
MKIVVEVEIRPTEDEEKVKRAVLNFFTPSNIRIEDRGRFRVLIAEANEVEALQKLHAKLRGQKILDAARSMMMRWSSKDKVIFYLHKQAAFMDYITFCLPEGESPLGPIKVEISDVDAKSVIDWLAPPTSKGKPLFEREPPR